MTRYIGNAPAAAVITSDQLSDAVVTTAKLADDAVTKAKVNADVFASAAEQETGTATDVVVAPGTQHHHPSAAKGWVRWGFGGGTPVASASYNVTSLTDNGAGDTTINWGTDFSSATGYGASGSCGNSGGRYLLDLIDVTTVLAASTRVFAYERGTGGAGDVNVAFVAAFGDQ